MAEAKKARAVFVCQECGLESLRWQGRCPECNAWNTFVERTVRPAAAGRPARPASTGAEPVEIASLRGDAHPRIELGIAEFDRVLGGGIVPGSLVLIGGDPGIGKCLAGSTRVLNPETGNFLPITEYVDGTHSVLSLDPDEHLLRLRPVAAFHDQGERDVVDVTTRLGRVLRCTPRHPVLTPDGWRPVAELAAGDRLAGPRSLPFFGNDPMDEHHVRLLAYILSDGSATSQINVTSALPEVEQDVIELAQWLGLELRIYHKPNNLAKQYRFVNPRKRRAEARCAVAAALHRVRAQAKRSWAEWSRAAAVDQQMLHLWQRGKCVPSAAQLQRLAVAAGVDVCQLAPEERDRADMRTSAARFLEEHGARYSKAATQSIPDRIFRLPRMQLALFLKVLFSCDGSLFIGKSGLPGISYSTISHRLAVDVQHLLLRFGFTARLRTKHSTVADRPYVAYELQLLGILHIRRFLDEIGIWGREDAKARVAALADPQSSSTHFDTIPTGSVFWTHLREATAGVSFKEVSAKAGTLLRDRRHDRPLARTTVVALARAYPSFYLTRLADNDIYWDEIAEIRPAGRERVYDLSIADGDSFVANDVIVHNSTLLLEAASSIATTGRTVLYVSGEESAHQLKLRASRLGISGERLFLLTATDIEEALATGERLKPDLVVVDSIQTVFAPDLPNAPGTVVQLREATLRIMRWSKASNVPAFIVGHVTKEGEIAGPRLLEHLVDVVLYLEGERFSSYRLLRGVKNRFGATSEVGVFEMLNSGMHGVENPSEIFLAERAEGAVGSVIAPVVEGTRPLLVELQALTSPSSMSMPRRTAHGVELNRLLLIAAVLTKRARLQLYNQDLIVNVAGGLRVQEPAADLALALAITSSFRDAKLPGDLVAIGEVGLSGELRSVGHLDRRLAEAEKLGFRDAILPAASMRRYKPQTKLRLHPAPTLVEAIERAFVL